MNPSYLTSLQLSKKLKEAGVEQISKFAWGLKGITWILLYKVYNGWVSETGNWHARDEFEEFYSAFLSDELEGKFRDYTSQEQLPSIMWLDDCYHIDWEDGYTTALTRADASAELLLYLITNGIVKI